MTLKTINQPAKSNDKPPSTQNMTKVAKVVDKLDLGIHVNVLLRDNQVKLNLDTCTYCSEPPKNVKCY